MTDARPIDPVDTGIIEGPSNPSPIGVTAVIPFLPPPPTTQLEETPQSTVEPTRMNDEVVDDALRDLDPMSPPPKDLVLCPQPLAVREVIDLNSVRSDSNVHGGDSNINDPDVNVDDDPLSQRKRGRRDCDGPLTLPLTSVLHRPPLIFGVRTKKGQARQGGAGRALPGRIRRDPLWLDRGNHTELV